LENVINPIVKKVKAAYFYARISTFNYEPSTVFSDYARYYDLFYRDKDYAAEAECGSIFSTRNQSPFNRKAGERIKTWASP
jgi:hypothetical protein